MTIASFQATPAALERGHQALDEFGRGDIGIALARAPDLRAELILALLDQALLRLPGSAEGQALVWLLASIVDDVDQNAAFLRRVQHEH